MKTLLKKALMAVVLGCFSSYTLADAIGTAPAYCIKYGNFTYARVLTWHSPLLHYDPSDYAEIGVKMKLTGAYPKETNWYDRATYRKNPSWVAWYFYSNGTKPLAVTGSHRAKLSLTGAATGISPTVQRCMGI